MKEINFPEVKHGFGSKITGNVARLFLKDHVEFADVKKLPVELIENDSELLKIIRQTDNIEIILYSDKANAIINFYIETEMHLTQTIHKILFHGREILEFFKDEAGIGTGVFSEENGEAMIRKIRKIRTEHARRTDRISNIYDTFVYSYIFN